MTAKLSLEASVPARWRVMVVVAAITAATVGGSPARACMQQSDEVYTFTKVAPARPTDDTLRLLVRVKGRSNGEFLADLLPPFDRLPGVREVRITDPHTAFDCSRNGPMDGPAWVVGRVGGVIDGVLYIFATQRPSKPFAPRPIGSDRWRSYIVDPELKKLADK